MEDYVVDTCYASSSAIKAGVAEPPSSPVGVLDAINCGGSCEAPSEQNLVGSTEEQQ